MDCTANTRARAQILVGRIDNCIAIRLLDDIPEQDANLSGFLPCSALNH
jgi:hypothetical protein